MQTKNQGFETEKENTNYVRAAYIEIVTCWVTNIQWSRSYSRRKNPRNLRDATLDFSFRFKDNEEHPMSILKSII